jgi:hypothetical protein
MRLSARIGLAMVCLVTPLIAADATGKWSGTLGDDRSSQSMLLILQQDEEKLTGTAGADESQRIPIQNGTIRGNLVSFQVPLQDQRLLAVELKLEADEMSGTAEMKRDGQTIRTGKLSLKRQ